MDYDQQIAKLLDEIKAETGILFSVSDSDFSEEMTLQKLRQLAGNLAKASDRDGFLRQLLLGGLSEEEITRGMHRFHIADDAERVLFLIRFSLHVEDEARSVLSELSTPGKDLIISTDERHVAVITTVETPGSFDMAKTAEGLSDTLQAEAMSAVWVSYDKPVDSLKDLARSYAHCYTALEIGSLYTRTDSVYSYHELGLGKLVYSLSKEAATEYMEDHFSGFDPSKLDNETLNTVRTFFDNDLSIADTARELYIHRNTLTYRLDKFQKMSGLDIRKFDDAITCRIGLMLATMGVSDRL